MKFNLKTQEADEIFILSEFHVIRAVRNTNFAGAFAASLSTEISC